MMAQGFTEPILVTLGPSLLLELGLMVLVQELQVLKLADAEANRQCYILLSIKNLFSIPRKLTFMLIFTGIAMFVRMFNV
jgi:hypothetical protein